MSSLYIVPTPIGNLEDITLRALRVLKEVDFIICEDTRRSVKILTHYGISKPLISFYSHNQQKRIPDIISKLLSGKSAAIVSDGGSPLISDPGFFLVKECIENGIKVEPLPGASALITALIGSGLSTDGFVFCGFLKRKSGKIKKELLECAKLNKTIVFYESPHRVLKVLENCREIFDENLQVCIAREISKKFEEFIRGGISEVIEILKERNGLLGEVTVLINVANKIEN
ncbi:MAG: 16S rRNA (cytidine(1402)-2'-O)-methyltransferase [Elusimicrobiota bacterium]|nr:16S rRNA (cytidine(1402)-2'-O)-methyltransferase [Elusimicrobiota bacterium]